MAKSKTVGLTVKGVIVKVFAAVGNTDSNDPNHGVDEDISYHSTRKRASKAGKGMSTMGSDCKVEKRLAIRLDDGHHLLLAQRDICVHPKKIPWIQVQ